jgi:hypothetical protein
MMILRFDSWNFDYTHTNQWALFQFCIEIHHVTIGRTNSLVDREIQTLSEDLNFLKRLYRLIIRLFIDALSTADIIRTNKR